MESDLRRLAESARGFMPVAEGLALYEAATRAANIGPLLEIGSYCGKSALYLGAAARARDTIVFSIDHHRGSEEHQAGEEYHDPQLLDADGRIDSLGEFRDTVVRAGLEEVVVAIVGRSETVASWWGTPLGLVLIDGGHSQEAADADYVGWAPWVARDGILALHDVFEDPKEGGRPPYIVYERALASGVFEDVGATGSMRFLKRVREGL